MGLELNNQTVLGPNNHGVCGDDVTVTENKFNARITSLHFLF